MEGHMDLTAAAAAAGRHINEALPGQPRIRRQTTDEGRLIEGLQTALAGRGGGRLSAADSARLRPLSDGTGKDGLLFAGGWSERRDAAGRVHAIAFFRKKYRIKCGF